ncbi:probable aspartic proteinase GIP2 [Lotus japonicus]|uniref:probable aspartic proteinase GIP2 n=1 Tax=Lotus japonicus TaxID=34305 RepID=UPI00258C07AF|nr:probable aspartic proteinase GIP2 [Lotus japonicus]
MSSSSAIHCFLLLSIALFSICYFPPTSHALKIIPRSFILPIKKDPATNLFYTSLGIGTPRQDFNLAVDLIGENLWYDCNTNYNSSTYHPIACGAKRCPDVACIGCNGPYKPGCTNNTCPANAINSLAKFIFGGGLGEDLIFFSKLQVPGLLSGCIDTDGYPSFTGEDSPLNGLPKSTRGIIGLARSQLALPLQLAEANKLPAKFSLCLPSSNKQGFTNLLASGKQQHPLEVSKSVKFQTTPLIVNPVATGAVSVQGEPSKEYFIDVKSVKIDGKVVNLKPSLLSIDQKKGSGGTKISTISPFTELQSTVYKTFIKDYIKKASDRKLKRVAAVAPFEVCFDSTTIGNSVTGLVVPTIDLVLPGGVQWKILGANSMMMVKKNVACLAIVDGGTKPRMSFAKAAIVIGGHQLVDNLLEFDLASSKLSFSSSLLLHNSTCS